MDIYDNTNVLDEVESLFNKLESVPDSSKHGVFSKIQEKMPNQITSENILLHAKDHNQRLTVMGKKKGALSFIDDVTHQNRSTKRMNCGSWEDEDTLETLHEMLFSEENYPWTDHAYGNKLYYTNIAQDVKGDNDWLFEHSPSDFHTYSNISGILAGSKTNDISKTAKKVSDPSLVDPRKKPFVCIECNRCFPDVYYLNLHEKRHKGEKDFLCDQCPYMSYDKDELKRHIGRVHHKEKSVLCEFCGILFSAKANAREHMKRVHFQEEKVVCNQCNYETYSHISLRRHILCVHERQLNNHLCPVCGFKTRGRQNFLNHFKSHIEHKSFKCDTCGKSFALKKQLSAHVQIVHQARQFPCEVCNKRFQSKFHLDRHLTIHSNSRPFPCPFCLYASNTHSTLSKHVRSIHQRKDFSIKKFKDQESEVNVECIERGMDVTVKYLDDLSKQLGEDITLQSLQEQRLLHEMAREVERLNSKKLDHSYSEKFDSETGTNEVGLLLFNMHPLITTDTEMTFSVPSENDIQVTVSKTDFERSLQAHYQRVQEELYCNRTDILHNKNDQMLSGGDLDLRDA